MDDSMVRWLSGERTGTMLDIALRMKADLEKTGGEGIRRFMGGEAGTDGWTFEMRTEEMLNWQLAATVNVEAATMAEVRLKAILAGRQGLEGRKFNHGLLAAHSKIGKEAQELLEKEYRCLCRLAESTTVNKRVGMKTLEEVLERLEGRLIPYRYLDLQELEAHDWWSFWVACEALGNAAATWLSRPPCIPDYPGTMLVSDPGLSKEDRRKRRRNTKQRMARVLGRDIEPTQKAQKEDAVWQKP